MAYTFQFAWEIALIQWLQTNVMTIPFVKEFLIFITDFADSVFVVMLVCFLYWVYDKKLGVYLSFNIIFTEVFNSMIKNIFFRNRPYYANDEIECLKAVESEYDINDMKAQGYSFPSGHSACSGAIVTSLFSYTKNKIIFSLSFVIYLLVCISRIALGVHYPSDVIVGILIGIICSLLIPFIVNKYGKKNTYIFLLLIGAIGFIFCKSNDYYSAYGLMIGFSFGDLFENKYINFNNTRNILKAFLRLLFGIAIFLLIIEGMKLPFSQEFLNADSLISHIFRSFRYGLGTFVVIGLYPKLFTYNIFKLDDKMEK